MTTHGSRCLPAALALLASGAATAAAPPSKDAEWRTSVPYKVMVALQVKASFVPDGAMRIADLAFSATFDDVVFAVGRRPPSTGKHTIAPAGSARGKLWLTRHAFCDVQGGGERHHPWVKQEWPTEFLAQLVAVDEPRDLGDGTAEDMPTVVVEGRLLFMADFGVNRLQWFSQDGSASLDGMALEFKVPWVDLLNGKPATVQLPYESDDAATTGKWWIEFTPKRK